MTPLPPLQLFSDSPRCLQNTTKFTYIPHLYCPLTLSVGPNWSPCLYAWMVLCRFSAHSLQPYPHHQAIHELLPGSLSHPFLYLSPHCPIFFSYIDLLFCSSYTPCGFCTWLKSSSHTCCFFPLRSRFKCSLEYSPWHPLSLLSPSSSSYHVLPLYNIDHNLKFFIGFLPVCLLQRQWPCLSVSLFFSELEFELRGLCLLGRCSKAWDIPPALFALACFGDRVSLFAQASGKLWSSWLQLPVYLAWQLNTTAPSYWLKLGLANFFIPWIGLEPRSSWSQPPK
jgi:hypothetical protein